LGIDGMALLVGAGFVLSATAAGAMLWSVVGTDRGAVRRLQRRLSPSADLVQDGRGREEIARRVAVGLTPLARLATPSEVDVQLLRGRLAQAGWRAPWASQLFLASKAILALALLGGVLWFNAARIDPLPMLGAWALAFSSAGFFLPNLILDDRVRARQKAIDRSLPDAMDLLVTSVEAGLGLDATLQRVAAEIALAQPVLAEELTLTFLEVKAGVRRVEAFRRLAARTGVQDLKTLAATLNQTDMFGTSVATALRIQAEGMRVRRMQRAEERAATLSVKMTVPLVICFLPALLVVLVGPAAVNIYVNFIRPGSP
jgi:tight adherence protein C